MPRSIPTAVAVAPASHAERIRLELRVARGAENVTGLARLQHGVPQARCTIGRAKQRRHLRKVGRVVLVVEVRIGEFHGPIHPLYFHPHRVMVLVVTVGEVGSARIATVARHGVRLMSMVAFLIYSLLAQRGDIVKAKSPIGTGAARGRHDE